jgi:hypothetical protein
MANICQQLSLVEISEGGKEQRGHLHVRTVGELSRFEDKVPQVEIY